MRGGAVAAVRFESRWHGGKQLEARRVFGPQQLRDMGSIDGEVDDAAARARRRFARRAAAVAQRVEELEVRRTVISSKMLGGASQIVSKIRVKCNGT